MVKSGQYERGRPPNKGVNSTDRKSHPPSHAYLLTEGCPKSRLPHPPVPQRHPASHSSLLLLLPQPDRDQAPAHWYIPSQSQSARPATVQDGARPAMAWVGLKVIFFFFLCLFGQVLVSVWAACFYFFPTVTSPSSR